MAYVVSLLLGVGALDIIRRLSMITWAAVIYPVHKPLWRLAHGQPLFYDVLWSLFGGYALMVLLFAARAAFSPSSEIVYVGLYIFAIGLGVATIFVIRSYMRSHLASGRG